MSNTKNLVKTFQGLLKELEVTGPDERWQMMRKFSNLSLKLAEGLIEYENDKAENETYSEFFETGESITDEDRANVKQAIELRKQVYRRLKEIRKS